MVKPASESEAADLGIFSCFLCHFDVYEETFDMPRYELMKGNVAWCLLLILIVYVDGGGNFKKQTTNGDSKDAGSSTRPPAAKREEVGLTTCIRSFLIHRHSCFDCNRNTRIRK